MKLTYFGHSCVHIDTGQYRLIIDPFLTGNPAAKTKAEEIEADYVLLTHGHFDHLGDAEAIAKRTGATIVGIVELANFFEAKGVTAVGMNLGGSFQFPFGRLTFTPALHSSSVVINETNVYLGVAAGIVLDLNGFIIYHAGDTALFSDMKLIRMRRSINLAFLPIGDYFTMGPEEALIAAEWLEPKHVVPVHYNTFGLIAQDGEQFVSRLGMLNIEGHALKPGESLDTGSLK
ncbi:metal-dependent hydrolase [Paenibacillus sanfengchensis]|uniref:metal-dependent hydrolase n=1 Tax=Paenibacillus TaxID=44249 RepID=UPI003A5B9641